MKTRLLTEKQLMEESKHSILVDLKQSSILPMVVVDEDDIEESVLVASSLTRATYKSNHLPSSVSLTLIERKEKDLYEERTANFVIDEVPDCVCDIDRKTKLGELIYLLIEEVERKTGKDKDQIIDKFSREVICG